MQNYTINYNVILSANVQIIANSEEEAIKKLKEEAATHGISYHYNIISEEICDFDVVDESAATEIDEIFA